MGAIRDSLDNTIDFKTVRNVLEIGIGKGDFMDTLIKCFNDDTEFVGIDIVDEYIDIALERFKNKSNIKAMKMSAYDLTFEDNSFDLVCISNTLHHLANAEQVVQEMKRMVKTDGYILVHEMINDGQDVRQMVHVDVHHFNADIDRESGIHHNYTYSTDDLKELLMGQGLLIKNDKKYLIQDEQEMEDQYEILENIYRALEKRIANIESVEKREFFQKELEHRFSNYRDIGFALATEYIALLQK